MSNDIFTPIDDLHDPKNWDYREQLIGAVLDLRHIDATIDKCYEKRNGVEDLIIRQLGLTDSLTLDDGSIVTIKDNHIDKDGNFVNAVYRPARVTHYSVKIDTPKVAKAKK